MPDKQNGTPGPTKAELAGYIRSVNKTAAGLSDDEIIDKLASANPKIGKMVSDYANPLIQGPVPLKSKLPLISEVQKSVMKAGQVKTEKSVQEDFNDVEVLRAKADNAQFNYDAPLQPGQIPTSEFINRQQKYKDEALNYTKQGDDAFKKFQVKYNQDPEIQRLKAGAISSMSQFTAKDNLGSTYVDNAKLRNYIRTKMPQAANTQFEDYMVNNFGSDILFESKKPELQKTVLKKAKEKNIQVPENFLELNKEVAKNAQAISDNVTKQIQSVNQEASSQIQEINNGYKSQIEQIKQKYTNKDFVQQNFRTEDEFRAAYEKEVGDAFDNYSRNFSNVNARYTSIANKLKGDYERSMKNLQVSSERQRADISKLMQESLIDMNESENAKRLAISKVQDNLNPFAKGVTFGKAITSGLANWISNNATNISVGNNSQWASDFQDFSSNLSKKMSAPPSEIKSIKDLLDPDKFAASSGVMIGQMLPAIGLSVATRGALGGGIGGTLAAGTVQWFDEASQARASNYNSMVEQGLDPEEAKNRSNKTYAGYLATLPLSMIEASAMFGKFGKGSLLRRFGSNIAAEIPSETLQEVIQTESDDAIVNNRKLDFGKAFNVGNVYKTALNVAPASIVMPIPGSAMESARENEAISQTANWALRVTTAPIQSMANNITKNGLFANIASLEAMRHNGMLSEEGLNGMKSMLAEVNSDMETSKASGLNKKQQSVYAGLMGNVRNLEDAVAEIGSQDMTDEARKEALDIANKRLNNAREVASDYLNTKNGNYAEIVDKDGDKYIVSHDELSEMLGDESFRNDVKDGNARVQLNYNKKAGERLGELSKTLLSLNKNFNEGLREYNQSEQQLNALRKKLNIPEQPTSSTTVDGLVGQRVTYRVNKFPVKINMTGILGVQNGNLVLDTEDGGVVKLGKASEMAGMMPSDLNIEFEPQRYQGPKMTQAEAKLPSLLAMFAGKIDPKTLSQILSDVISDVKKSELNKMVKAFDSAYQRKMQQKAINESLPKPAKQIEVVEPEVGKEYDGNEVSEVLAQVGDKSAKSFFDKIMSFSLRNFIASSLDLDDLYENNEEFRNRVEQERGEKKDRYVSEYSNTERVPAVIIDGKVADGMSRLARLYVNGDKIATVFENIKTKKDATTASQRQIEEGRTTGDISQREGIEEGGAQEATAQADTGNRNIGRQKIKTEPAIAKITSDNINDVVKIPGNKVQKKVLNDVKKVVLAIKDLVKESIGFDVEVNIHNQESFTKAVLEIGGTKQQSVARGFYMASDGSIHINLDTANSDTMLHEGFHPILDYLAAKNPLFIEKMYKQLSAIPEAISSIEQAIEGYKGETTQKKEAITDFVAGIADGRIVLNPNNFQKIKSYVLNILNKIGIGQGGSKLMNVTNENELIKLANFVTEKFRAGEVVTAQGLTDAMNKPSGYQDKFGRIITSGKAQFSLNNDFSDVKTKTTFSYLKNDSEFERLKNSGYITEDKTLDNFIGKKMMLHAPDNAFTGQILKNGEILVEGKGGVFYPVRFHEDGYFWASTATAAKSMANRLNQMLVANGGKIYMALVSSPADKLLSSTTAANGVVELFSSSALDRAIGISQSSVIDALANAAVVTSEKKIKKKDKNGNDVIGPDGKPVYITKNIGLNIKIPKSKVVDGKRVNATIEDIKAKISDKLSAENSTFEDRKVFSTAFITNIVDAIKGKKAEQILGQFFDKGILNTSFQQQGKIENKYNLSKANVIQSVSEMLSEPMLKGTKSGQVYAILEIDGQVEPIESNKHESYPMAIRSKEGNKTTLHILQNREDWSTRFADPETGETVTEDRLLNVFPTSGVSSEALTVLPKLEEPVAQFQMAPIKKIPSADIIDGFYSPIEDRINTFKQPKSSVQKWKEIVGMKSDEAVFSGLADWLGGMKPDRQLSKDEVLKFMKDNRIEIKEVVKGAGKEMSQSDMDDVYNGVNERLARTNQPQETKDFIQDYLDKWYNNPTDTNLKALEGSLGEADINLGDIIDDVESRMDDTRYENYQLPGGENYKEVLITLPKSEPFILSKTRGFDTLNYSKNNYGIKSGEYQTSKRSVIDELENRGLEYPMIKQLFESYESTPSEFKSSHFNEPNIITHLRMNTRTDADGKKVLFLEEVQSDWGQKGKREGFKKDYSEERQRINKEIETIDKDIDSVLQEMYSAGLPESPSSYELEKFKNGRFQTKELINLDRALDKVKNNRDYEAITKEIESIERNQRSLSAKRDSLLSKKNMLKSELKNLSDAERRVLDYDIGVAKAPYVTNTNAWVKLGLKVALKEAVKQGADRIAWTTGEQQNERYDLRKQVDSIAWEKDADGTYAVTAEKNGSTISSQTGLTPAKLEEAIGKDAAEKIVNSAEDNGVLEGNDLAVGGKGMKAFYGDVQNTGIVGNVAKALVKELTGKSSDLVESPLKTKGSGEYVVAKTTDDIKKFSKRGDRFTYNGEDISKSKAYEIIERGGQVESWSKSDSVQPAIDITPELAQSVQQGIPQFQMAAPTRSKMQAVKDTLPLGNKLSPSQLEKLAKGVTLWQQWATSYGLLGKEAKIAEEYKVGYVSQELYKADKAVKNVVKEIERAKKSGFNVTDEDITRFLTGQRAPAGTQQYSVSMPNYLKRALTVMRIHIDSMTEEMILNGVINDPEEIQQFRDNKGKYLGRFYDMFINGKGLTLNNIIEKLKDVDETVMEKARDLIRSEVTKSVTRANPTLTPDELNRVIENEVEDILNNIVEDISNPYVKRPMKGSVNMKQLTERQDIVEPIRALMGEVTNPISRYYATIGKMSSIVAGMKYLNEIRQIGMGKFFFEQNDPNRPKGTVRISSDTNKNLLPLAGLYTFPEIRDEFANYMVYQDAGTNILSKAMGTAKYMNTVGNLPTHIKNFASNIGILVNNGYIFDATNAIQFIINEPKAFEKAYEELRKSGTLNNNINATELRNYFQDNNDIDKVLSNKFKKGNVVKKVGKGLTDLYNLEDDVFKVIAYIVESQRYAKALYKVEFSQLSNADKDAVSKKSVDIVKSILPLFSRVPPFVKGMNKFLYLGTFMTFTAESVRISKNTILLALRELADPDTRYIGAKRLAGVIAWNTAYGWGTTTSAAAVGSMATGAFTYWINAVQQLLSDDDENKKRAQKEKSIRRVVRDYNISSDIYPTQASDGKLIYYDIGSINPYNFMTNFLNRLDQLTRDEGEGTAMDILRALGGSLSPFVKQDFIFSRLITAFEALSGGRIPENSYGKKIYREGDNAYEKAIALSKYVGDVFTPGMVRSIFKAKDMVKEGDIEAAKAEAVSTLTVRKVVVDGEKWFYGRIKSGASPYINDIQSYAKDYSSITYKNVPDSEKEAVYQESVAKIKRMIYETAKDYKAAIDIGVDEGKLYESLSKAGYSDENIAAILESVNGGVENLDNELFLRRRH